MDPPADLTPMADVATKASNKKPALFLLNNVEDLISGANEDTFTRNASGVCRCVSALRATSSQARITAGAGHDTGRSCS
jgi:hypothetical protein